jgi:lipoprotein-releasing system ATP-binding protein
MLKAENIHKSFGMLEVLKGVNLEVKASEVVSIVGKSGSGKSTLLHILGTLDDANQGQIFLDGQDISKMKQRALADFRNNNIGFIFQFHHLLNEFSALENVCIPAYIKDGKKSEAKKRAAELLDFLGLSERLDHKPNQLSGGEQQRVAVARALMNKPKIVFADEPSGNLDKVTSDDLHDLIFKLRDELGQTFVIVTHNEELAGLSDRILEINDGIIS